MSSQKTLLDKFPKNALSYFRFYLLANWQQFVLYLILCFLACVLPTILDVSEAQRHGIYANQGYDIAQAMGIVFVVISCVLGIFSGMAANSYVNSKQATNCFHSIPMRRESLFVMEGAARFLYYAVSSSVMYSISMSVLLLTYGVWENAFTMIWNNWLIGVLSYLVVFTLFQLAGALTATAGFRFCMAGIIAFLPIALYFLVVGCVATSMDSIHMDYYIEVPSLRWICPAYLIIYVTFGLASGEVGYPVLQILSLLIPSILYYTAAIFLHRKRRSEMAANSVIWNKIKVIVKYLVVFTAGICGAILMYSGFGGGFSWMVFGTVCGLILSFILMNVLINRSTKSMFKGIAGLGITTAATAVFLLIFMFDVFHLDSFMYSADNIREIELKFSYPEEEIRLTEREDIERILPALEAMNGVAYIDADYAVAETDKFIDADEETIEKISTYFSGYYDDDYKMFLFDNYELYMKESMEYDTTSRTVYDIPAVEATEILTEIDTETIPYYLENSVFNSRRVYYVVKPKFGITLAKTGRIHPISGAAKHMEELAYSKGYMDYLTELENRIAAREVREVTFEYNNSYWSEDSTKQNRIMKNGKTYQENLIQVYKESIPADVNSALIGSIEFYVDNGMCYPWPLYAGMTEVLDLIAEGCSKTYVILSRYDELPIPEENYCPAGMDYVDWIAEEFTGFLIVERGTGRSWYTEEKDDIRAILHNSTNINYYRNNVLSGAGDTEYLAVGVRGVGEETEYYNIDMMVFRDGVIPNCVTEKFS